MENILIIEDNQDVNLMLAQSIKSAGYGVKSSFTGIDGLNEIKTNSYSLVLLDIMLPYKSGDEILKEVRQFSQIPIIIISAKDMISTKIDLLKLGADDYITKPFNVKIAMQRINAVLRRVEGIAKTSVYVCGNLYIDFDTHMVKKSGEIIHLTPTEYKLLYTFVKNPNIALTRSLLLEKLWDNEGNFVDEHTLTINISRLKSKISDDQYTYIKTIYSMGYQWIGDSND